MQIKIKISDLVAQLAWCITGLLYNRVRQGKTSFKLFIVIIIIAVLKSSFYLILMFFFGIRTW